MSLLTRYKTPSAPAQVLAEGHDLSPEGLFISSERPEPLGTLLEVEWEARGSGRTLRALGRVAWIRPEPHEGKPAGMGVEFVRTGPDGRRAISSMPPPAPEDAAVEPAHEGASAGGGNGIGADPHAADSASTGSAGASQSTAPEGNGAGASGAEVGIAERRARLAALRDRVSRARRGGHEEPSGGRGNGADERAEEASEPAAAPTDGATAEAAAPKVEAGIAAESTGPAPVAAPVEAPGDERGDDEWESAPTTMMTAATHMSAAVEPAAAPAVEPEPEAIVPASDHGAPSDEITTTDAAVFIAASEGVTATDVDALAASSPLQAVEAGEDPPAMEREAASEAVYELTEDDDDPSGDEAAAAAAEAGERIDDERAASADAAPAEAEPAPVDDTPARSGAAAPAEEADEPGSAPARAEAVEGAEEDEPDDAEAASAAEVHKQPTRSDSARPFLLKGDVPRAQFRWKPVMVGATYLVALGLVVWAIWIRLPWEFLAWLEGPPPPAPVEQAAAPAAEPAPAEPPAPAPSTAPPTEAALAQEYALRVTTVPPRAQATVGNVTIVTPGVLSLGAFETPVTLTINLGGYQSEQLVIDRQGFAPDDGLMKRTLSLELLPQGASPAPAALIAAPTPAPPPAAPPPTPAPAPATTAATPKPAAATPAPRAPKPVAKPKAPPAPAPAPAPAPVVEEPKETPLQIAQACLMKGDNACVIQALEGKARTPRELELLVETYRATGNPAKQWETMRRYVERFPDEKKAAKYRETLGE